MPATRITADDVFEACEALLAAGERPTIERVRLHLGRGSPALVTRHLDAWWASLADSLKAQRAIPGIPDPILGAVKDLWAKAVSEAAALAAADATKAFDAERVRLTNLAEIARQEAELAKASRAEAEALRDQYAHELHTARQAAQIAHAEAKGTQARVLDLQDQLARLREQLAGTQADRSQALARADELAQEVARQAAYAQGLEERTARQLDDLRLDLRRVTDDARTQAEAMAKEREASRAAAEALRAEVLQRDHQMALLRTELAAAAERATREEKAATALADQCRDLRAQIQQRDHVIAELRTAASKPAAVKQKPRPKA